MTRSILVVGAGKRVRETALPALASLAERYTVAGVLARSARTLAVEGAAHPVTPLAALDSVQADLVYVAVGKDAVAPVLAALLARGAGRSDLLIDTPVLRFKHLGHLGLLARFRNAWVAEDCAALPVFDALRAFLDSGAIGPLRRVVLERSAYAYHGVAMGRTLLGARRVSSARRIRLGDGLARRTVRFAGGGELAVVEPRDFALGRVRLEGALGSVSDDPAGAAAHRLAPVVEDGRCTAFRAGEHAVPLSEPERALMGRPLAAQGGVTLWMEGMKRVGFRRLLERIDAGAGAYPVEHALEDTVVDYHLEKLGAYVANPVTSPQFASARLVYRALTRLARN